MREHIETLVGGLTVAMHRRTQRVPRRRRPHVARSTYIAVRNDFQARPAH